MCINFLSNKLFVIDLLQELLSLQQRSTSPMLIVSLRAIKFADLKALVDVNSLCPRFHILFINLHIYFLPNSTCTKENYMFPTNNFLLSWKQLLLLKWMVYDIGLFLFQNLNYVSEINLIIKLFISQTWLSKLRSSLAILMI